MDTNQEVELVFVSNDEYLNHRVEILEEALGDAIALIEETCAVADEDPDLERLRLVHMGEDGND